MKVLTLKEAVQRVKSGGNLEGVVLEKRSIQQVNVRDAMVLARGGIVIPEQNIYYNDEEIEYDADIDELEINSGVVNLSWEEKAKRAEAYREKSQEHQATTIDLSTEQPEIDAWIAKNKEQLAKTLKPIVINLFEVEKEKKEQ